MKLKRIAGDCLKCKNPEWLTDSPKTIAHELGRAGSSASEDVIDTDSK